jgi:hypothetical protein
MEENEIQRQVEATLGLADQVSPVSPPPGLKSKVMQGVREAQVPVVRPQWLRPALSIAAAVVVLAVNTLTIAHFVRSSQAMQVAVDPIDEIRTEYSLNRTDL